MSAVFALFALLAAAPPAPPPVPAEVAAPVLPVPAYTIPFAGWSAYDASSWQADSGVCLIREEKHPQEFPAFTSQEAAGKFAVRLQQTLYARKLEAVYTQPVERSGTWGVLASYLYTADGQAYKISQLYLSEGGKLRTFTGSAKDGSQDACVNDMLSFVRYLAN